MAKDPAFLFYPGDWLGGTIGMTFEEKGAYMDVLILQFNRGHMTEDMIAHMLGHTFGRIWVKIKDKFQIDENGMYYNPRLDEEKEKRKRFIASRLNNKTGKNQYQKKDGHMRGHMTYHMENENENRNKYSSSVLYKGGSGGKKTLSGISIDLEQDKVYFDEEKTISQNLGRMQKEMFVANQIQVREIYYGVIY